MKFVVLIFIIAMHLNSTWAASQTDVKTLLVCGQWPDFLYILENDKGEFEQLISSQNFIGQSQSNNLEMQLVQSGDSCILNAKPNGSTRPHVFEYKLKKGNRKIEHLSLANGKKIPEDYKSCTLHESYIGSFAQCRLEGIETKISETQFCLKCLLDTLVNGEVNGAAPVPRQESNALLAVSQAAIDSYIVGEWALFDPEDKSNKQAFPPLVIRRDEDNSKEFNVISCPDFIRTGGLIDCRPRALVWMRRYGSLKINDEFKGLEGALGGNLFGSLTADDVKVDFKSQTNFNITIDGKVYSARRIRGTHLY